MLEEMTPRQFAEWQAACDVEKSITGWAQADLITTNLLNILGQISRSIGGPKFDPVELNSMVPHLDFDEGKPRRDSIKEFETEARMLR